MKPACFLLVVSLSIGAGACGQAPADDPENDAIVNDTAVDETAGTAGTSGTLDPDTQYDPAAPLDQDDPAAVQQAPDAELPATASPLALAGLIGALSLGGALGIRLLGRR